MRASAGEFGLILKPLNLVVLKNKNKKIRYGVSQTGSVPLSSAPLVLGVRSGVSVLLERVADLAAKCVNS